MPFRVVFGFSQRKYHGIFGLTTRKAAFWVLNNKIQSYMFWILNLKSKIFLDIRIHDMFLGHAGGTLALPSHSSRMQWPWSARPPEA